MNGFKYENGKIYYVDKDGNYATDWQFINGEKYFFNARGELIGDGPTKKVIDVSHYQGEIDWYKVKNEGYVDGAILQIGYGYDPTNIYNQFDKTFKYNYLNGKANGVEMGIYLYSYAQNVFDAKAEAERVIALLKDMNISPEDISLPIYYDLEEYKHISKSLMTEMAVMFCKTIESAGYKAGVYASTYYYYDYLEYSAISEYSIWVAQYNYDCEYNNPYDIWQYSSQEFIPGIKGNVDVNVWF